MYKIRKTFLIFVSMKESTRLLKELLNRAIGKKQKTTTEEYAKRFEAIETLIDHDLLAVDFKDIFVTMDVKIHLLFSGDDRKYLAFFDSMLAYINMNRGLLSGMTDEKYPFINPKDAQVNFLVITRHPKSGKEYEPLLIGFAKQKN